MRIAREEWIDNQSQYPINNLLFLDESNAKTNMTRFYGRAKNGNRCYDSAPHGHYKSMTMLSTIWATGKTETIVYEGSTDKAIFELYIEEFLLPHIKENDILVMDNLATHKSAWVREIIESKKANVLFLPPYSPDLNPIEQMWSKAKSILRKLKPRTVPELYENIKIALGEVTENDALGWFAHSGYK